MINELNLDTILLSFDMLVFLVTSTDTIFLISSALISNRVVRRL